MAEENYKLNQSLDMKAVIIIFSVFVFLLSCSSEQTDKAKPNIVLIIADDLGWKDVGYIGAEFYETPNIDKLAADGMIFNRFYPGAANCAPSRATLLTGMYMPRHRVYIPQGLARGGEVSKMRFKVPTRDQDSTFNTFHVNINQVNSEFESLAEMLKKAGYTSARIGKWHIGDDNQGFDFVSANGEPGFITNFDGDEQRFYSDIHVAEKMTNTALKFMEENKDNPFFLYLSHWEVHTPIKARKERIAYFENKKAALGLTDVNPDYAAEIEQVDLSVGRVRKKLKELGLDKNTVVIFTSDNGGVSAQTSNLPLRAGKGTYYEGGIRVPFCIHFPGLTKPGTKTDIAINGVDFMPTFAEIAQAEIPQNQPVDGLSFLPVLKNEPFDAERPVFFHFPLYIGGGGSDKILPAYDGTPNYWRGVPSSTILSGDWKLIYYYEYEKYELYNLKDDISEQNDLSKINPEKAKEMLARLQAWVKEVDAPVPDVLNTD